MTTSVDTGVDVDMVKVTTPTSVTMHHMRFKAVRNCDHLVVPVANKNLDRRCQRRMQKLDWRR